MKTLEISAASKPLSEYAKELDDVIVLTSQNKPVAVLISLEKVDKETLSLSISPEFLEIIENAREEFKSGRKLSLEEMKQAVLP